MRPWWATAVVASLGRTVAALLAVVLLGIQGSALGDDQAGVARLLGRMNDALRSLDYEGTLVFLSGNRMETIHLVHRVEGGQVQERMVSLSGPIRAVSREPHRVTCVLADGHPILVERHRSGHLLQTAAIDPGAITDSYRVELLGRARTAGRDTDVIAIRPGDDLRYGLQLQLDTVTGLPLKSDLIDHDGEPIEQLMFTSLVVSETGRGVPVAQAPVAPGAEAQEQDGPVRPTRWRFERVPPGFEQRMHDVVVGPGGDEMEQFVFSDRLSAYSVYVETGGEDGLDGVSRIGAIHAAGRRVDGYQVTAVGEVPAATVLAAVNGAHLSPAPVATAPGR